MRIIFTGFRPDEVKVTKDPITGRSRLTTSNPCVIAGLRFLLGGGARAGQDPDVDERGRRLR
jgi:hypothetical protein